VLPSCEGSKSSVDANGAKVNFSHMPTMLGQFNKYLIAWPDDVVTWSTRQHVAGHTWVGRGEGGLVAASIEHTRGSSLPFKPKRLVVGGAANTSAPLSWGQLGTIYVTHQPLHNNMEDKHPPNEDWGAASLLHLGDCSTGIAVAGELVRMPSLQHQTAMSGPAYRLSAD
jgi:hypothetical protein